MDPSTSPGNSPGLNPNAIALPAHIPGPGEAWPEATFDPNAEPQAEDHTNNVEAQNETGEPLTDDIANDPDLRERIPKETDPQPSYFDRYKVWDEHGNALLLNNGPIDIRDYNFVAVSDRPMPADTTGVITDINGEQLYTVAPVTRRQRARARVGGAIYNRLDSRYNLERSESVWNADEMKLSLETTNTGPDMAERILFTTRNVNGTLKKYDGTLLTPFEIRLYKTHMRLAKSNKARYQAVAAYEIGKLEEQEQAGPHGGWERIINIMHQDLGYTKEEIAAVGLGLQFMKKATYLTFKHRGIDHPWIKNPDGTNMVGPDGKYGQDTSRHTSRLIFGKLKGRAYATELADKVKGYETTFSPADVIETIRLAEESKATMDRYFDDPVGRTQREFLNAAFIMRKLKATIDLSRMASPTSGEPTDENMARLLAGQYESLGAAERLAYPPRISGSAEANELWRELAVITDAVKALYPCIRKPNREDYRPLSENDYA